MKCRWEKQVQVWLAGEQVWLRGDGKFCGTTRGRLSQLSLHPSVQRVLGLGKRVQTFLPPVTTTSSFRGIPKLSQANWHLSSFLHVLHLRLLNGHLWRDVLTKCLYRINRLIWRCRSRSSTLSSFWMSELLTPLSLCPAPPTKEPFGAACTCIYCSDGQSHTCDVYVNWMLCYVKQLCLHSISCCSCRFYFWANVINFPTSLN